MAFWLDNSYIAIGTQTANAKDLIRPARLQWECSPVRSQQDGLILLNGTAAPITVDAMGILSSLVCPANGNTAGERECEPGKEQIDQGQRGARRRSLGSHSGRDERRAGCWIHEAPPLREDNHE